MTIAREADALLDGFAAPPPGYGPVPFWWWVGGRLDAARLCGQLDRLRARGVYAAVISYNHHADASPDRGDPPVFSPEWWVIFRAMLDHARAHGMTIGIQDYALLSPEFQAVPVRRPDLAGRELRHLAATVAPGAAVRLPVPAGASVIEASAWRAGARIDLEGEMRDGALDWQTPPGGDASWQIVLVYARPCDGIDPLHADAGAYALSAFQERIAAGVGDHMGTTLGIFFQDELDFGGRFPFWNDDLPRRFLAEKDYPLDDRLAELFVDRDSQTAKLRLDFADVAAGMAEAHFFRPIYEWHAARGLLHGHDNAGRGAIGVGRAFYGDYMRMMRWYSAPGSDDPDLTGPRAFKGLKIASSIAALHDRPRVWAECFHSSGWGVTPADILRGVNGVLALGATVINLHALYYATAGSRFEWAPPDFHDRQPFWACMAPFNAAVARLCWLLSQGERRCDVALLYPIAALDGGLNQLVDAAAAGEGSLSETQRNEAPEPIDAAEAALFSAARRLYDAGVDVEIVDDASLPRLLAEKRVDTLVLPCMRAIRWASLVAARDFARAGGRVVVLGEPPRASERAGSDDPALDTVVAELLAAGAVILRSPDADAAALLPAARRSFRAADGPVHALHRSIDGRDLWFIHNPARVDWAGDVMLTGAGDCVMLDPLTGTRHSVPVRAGGNAGESRLRLAVPAGGAIVLMFDPTCAPASPAARTDDSRVVATLATGWRYELLPTLDNRDGDFAGTTGGQLGLEIHRLDWAEGAVPDQWRPIAPGHAPRYRVLGPVPAKADFAAWEATLATTPAGAPLPDLAGFAWEEQLVSRSEGILDDPFVKHWASGPHGLKPRVPDDFIDLGEGCAGDCWYIATTLRVTAPGAVHLLAGSRAAYRLWCDGRVAIDQPRAEPPGRYPVWHLPHYEATARTARASDAGDSVALAMRIVDPGDQRIRAHVGLADAPPAPGRQRWLSDARLRLDPLSAAAPAQRQWFRLLLPPGTMTIKVDHVGALSAWRGDRALAVTPRANGSAIASGDGPGSDMLLLAIDAPRDVRAGDCITGPVRIEAPTGPITVGDWCAQGLAPWSGGVSYSASFELSDSDAALALAIETGPVGAAATVVLNGRDLGCILAAPWRLPLDDAARAGPNTIEIRVFNTLANHYAEASPSPYVFAGQTQSGLLHPPRIVTVA